VFENVTLAQLRVLLAVVEAGSFSAAARRLRRVQSAISQAMANLEEHLGVVLWDRSTKVPTLTDGGRAVVVAARRICDEVDALRRLAAGMSQGLEAQVSLCVDGVFPLSAVVDLCREFAEQFPTVALRVDTQTLAAVSSRVLSGAATLGVANPAGLLPGLQRLALAPIRMVPVVAAAHPLASIEGVVDTARLGEHVQLVLSERDDAATPDQAVLSPRTWRVADLHTKLALLRAGLGWGNVPEFMVAHDLEDRRLVRLRPAAWGADEHTLHLVAVHRPDAVLGPAHRWVLARLADLCAREAPITSRPTPSGSRPGRRPPSRR
jgi:DNA-binding transcriptional LysR family regulator